jgi:putative SOS response-associated peptidase YedK
LGEEYWPFRPTKAGGSGKPYNFAPTVLVDEDGGRIAKRMRWGLLPFWAKDDQEKLQPNNARGEDIAKNRMFGNPFKTRRCLVPASGFFESPANRATGKAERTRFAVEGQQLFSFAGLWNRFSDELSTFTFVTAAPSEWFSQFHDRQPVILDPADYDRWLDPKTPIGEIEGLLRPWTGKMSHVLAPKPPKAAASE